MGTCRWTLCSLTCAPNVHYVNSAIWPCQRSCTWSISELHVTLDIKYNCAKFYHSPVNPSWVMVYGENRETDGRTDIQEHRIKCSGEHLISHLDYSTLLSWLSVSWHSLFQHKCKKVRMSWSPTTYDRMNLNGMIGKDWEGNRKRLSVFFLPIGKRGNRE